MLREIIMSHTDVNPLSKKYKFGFSCEPKKRQKSHLMGHSATMRGCHNPFSHQGTTRSLYVSLYNSVNGLIQKYNRRHILMLRKFHSGVNILVKKPQKTQTQFASATDFKRVNGPDRKYRLTSVEKRGGSA